MSKGRTMALSTRQTTAIAGWDFAATIADNCQRLGVSRRTIYRWLEKGSEFGLELDLEARRRRRAAKRTTDAVAEEAAAKMAGLIQQIDPESVGQKAAPAHIRALADVLRGLGILTDRYEVRGEIEVAAKDVLAAVEARLRAHPEVGRNGGPPLAHSRLVGLGTARDAGEVARPSGNGKARPSLDGPAVGEE